MNLRYSAPSPQDQPPQTSQRLAQIYTSPLASFFDDSFPIPQHFVIYFGGKDYSRRYRVEQSRRLVLPVEIHAFHLMISFLCTRPKTSQYTAR
jgi:hypothetical protein